MTQLDLFPPPARIRIYLPNGMIFVRDAKPGEMACAICYERLIPERPCCWRCLSTHAVRANGGAEQFNEGASK
jgi:hypothetical protein